MTFKHVGREVLLTCALSATIGSGVLLSDLHHGEWIRLGTVKKYEHGKAFGFREFKDFCLLYSNIKAPNRDASKKLYSE